jgi:hypothetical protein
MYRDKKKERNIYIEDAYSKIDTEYKEQLKNKEKEELDKESKKREEERLQEKAEKERAQKAKDEKEIAEKTKDTKKVPAQDIEEQKRLQKIAQREKERVDRDTAAIKKTKYNVDYAIKTITDYQLLETALIKEYHNASYYRDVGVAFNNYISENKYIPEDIKEKLAGIALADYTKRRYE